MANKKKSDEASRTQRAAAFRAQQQRRERMGRVALVGGIVAAVVVLVGAITLTLMSNDTSGQAADRVPSGVTDDYGVVLGEEGAPKEVTVYEDFQCPICKQFEGLTGGALEQGIEDGNVQVEYRMVSFLDKASANEYSSRALNAALAVLDTAGKDAFKKFHDALYDDQPAEGGPGPEDDALVEKAVAAGAEEDAVRPLIEDKVFEQWITNATDAMSENDVTGTPTVFVDGKKIDGVQEGAQAAVEAAQGQ